MFLIGPLMSNYLSHPPLYHFIPVSYTCYHSFMCCSFIYFAKDYTKIFYIPFDSFKIFYLLIFLIIKSKLLPPNEKLLGFWYSPWHLHYFLLNGHLVSYAYHTPNDIRLCNRCFTQQILVIDSTYP